MSDAASKTYPAQASAIKKGGFVVIKGRPCKVNNTTTSKTGKHGHAKVHMYAVDIFNGKKYEDICPSTHNMQVPNVSREEFLLIDIDEEGFASLMMDDGETKNDLKIPDQAPHEELGAAIREAFDDGKDVLVTVQAAMDDEAIVGWKLDAGNE